MNCSDFENQMIDRLSGELNGEDSKLLDAHLARCEACRKRCAELEKLWSRTKAACADTKSDGRTLTPERIERIRDEFNSYIDTAPDDGELIRFRNQYRKRFLYHLAAALVIASVISVLGYRMYWEDTHEKTVKYPLARGRTDTEKKPAPEVREKDEASPSFPARADAKPAPVEKPANDQPDIAACMSLQAAPDDAGQMENSAEQSQETNRPNADLARFNKSLSEPRMVERAMKQEFSAHAEEKKMEMEMKKKAAAHAEEKLQRTLNVRMSTELVLDVDKPKEDSIKTEDAQPRFLLCLTVVRSPFSPGRCAVRTEAHANPKHLSEQATAKKQNRQADENVSTTQCWNAVSLNADPGLQFSSVQMREMPDEKTDKIRIRIQTEADSAGKVESVDVIREFQLAPPELRLLCVKDAAHNPAVLRDPVLRGKLIAELEKLLNLEYRSDTELAAMLKQLRSETEKKEK